MTRFARAKGSKSSNERTPEDSTPWEVMKKQLLETKKENDETKKRHEAEQQRIENYENFLKERKVQKRKATWCEFPDSEVKRDDKLSEKHKPINNKKKKKSKLAQEALNDNGQDPKEKIVMKKNEPSSTTVNMNQNGNNSANVNGLEQQHGSSKKTKKKKKKNTKTVQESRVTDTQIEDQQDCENTEEMGKIKRKKSNISSEARMEPDQEKKPKKKNKKNAQKQDNSSTTFDETQSNTDHFKEEMGGGNTKISQNNQMQKNKNKKFLDGKPTRRKEINDRSFQLIINSKEVELTRFDGFPIMKKDAERLEELKDSMIKKGIPKSEVQRTIKLERRRAEKALARLKRDVCYNCRKGGHVLSDCPELKSKIPGVDAAEGVCFKCGSTEHRQFECKVQRDKEFRFATCFICKEPGHIARQCPDNPKGLYPNGGSCKLCGDVTHLRKDCPTVSDKKEESSIKLQTLDSTENIEDVGKQSKLATQETSKTPKKIKF